VLDSWNSYGSCVWLSLAEKFVDRCESFRAEFGGDGGGAGVLVVDEADEFDNALLRKIAVDTRVVASEGAHADSGGFCFSFQFPVSSFFQFKS
jgi:hypothetical protein